MSYTKQQKNIYIILIYKIMINNLYLYTKTNTEQQQ